MKQIPFALAALIFASSLCFAQPVSSLNIQVVSKPGEIYTFTGKVLYLSLADAVKGTKTEIGVEDEKGQKYGFTVNFWTAIYDKTGKRIDPDGIGKGNKVVIEYKFDSIKAKSIKLLE